MSLDEDQSEWLTQLLQDCESFESRLNDWERNFISDQASRVEKFGEHISMSPRQWETLRKIRNKIDGK